MNPELVLGLAILVLFVMLICGVPVAFSLASAGVAGLFLLDGVDIASATLGRSPFQTTASYGLIVIPMFVYMGILAAHAGIGRDVLALAHRVLRRLPGSLALATIAACAGFAAVTGSSIATVATVGRVAIREMAAYGYDRRFMAGIVGSAGTLGVLIPPSILLVIYGIMTGESVGFLLLAGLLPGVLSAIIYATYIVVQAVRRPELVGRPAKQLAAISNEGAGQNRPGGSAPEAVDAAVEQLKSFGIMTQLAGLLKLAILFLVVVGGIYSGTFTPTESGAMGAVIALVMVAFNRDKSFRSWWRLRDAVREAASMTAMIFAILIGGAIFAFFLVRAGTPRLFTDWVLELGLPPMLVVAALLLTLIPLGMFLDAYSILIITVPLTYPVISALGYDGIWFGILVIKFIELGLITPPVGLNGYVVASVADNLTAEDAFRGLMPFAALDLATIALLFAFPWLSTAVPEMMSG